MTNQTVIIDSDPGVDDALAIALAIKAKLPVKAICTVYGNSLVSNCTQNALSILELLTSSIKVYQGSNKPLKNNPVLAKSHGDNGLGGFSINTRLKKQNISATSFYEQIFTKTKKQNIIVVCIGPTTNLGKLYLKNPQLFNKISQIIIMGGVFNENGNITPYAEFNVYNDPYSLDLILKSKHSNIVLIPANICRKVVFSIDIFNKIKSDISKSLQNISQLYIDYYTNNSKYGGFNGGVMYDLLAITYLINPTIFLLEKQKISVDTNSNQYFGQTTISSGKPNCSVITQVNADKLKQLYLRIMNQ